MNARRGTTEHRERLHDFAVQDSTGAHLGTVRHVWAHELTDAPEFIGIRTDRMADRTLIVPLLGAQVDLSRRTIRVPYDLAQIQGAPAYPDEGDLIPEQDMELHRYYGLAVPDVAAAAAMGEEELRIPLVEEELRVGKREVERGRVRLRKLVRTAEVEQPIELRREDVFVEQVAATGQAVPADVFQDREIEVPLLREEAVVAREARVVGEARVTKRVDTEVETIRGQVRREEIEVERDDEETFAPSDPRTTR